MRVYVDDNPGERGIGIVLHRVDRATGADEIVAARIAQSDGEGITITHTLGDEPDALPAAADHLVAATHTYYAFVTAGAAGSGDATISYLDLQTWKG
jgi:hypothetical protein